MRSLLPLGVVLFCAFALGLLAGSGESKDGNGMGWDV
jgi:hypothetical protein